MTIAKLRAGKLSDALNELKVIGKDGKAPNDKRHKWLPAIFEEMNGSNTAEGPLRYVVTDKDSVIGYEDLALADTKASSKTVRISRQGVSARSARQTMSVSPSQSPSSSSTTCPRPA